MIEESIYLVLYLLAEVVSYLLAYTVIFSSNMTRRKSRFFFVIIILILIHFLFLHSVGMEGTTALPIFTMILIPVFLLEPFEKKNFLLYPFIIFGTSLMEVSCSFLFEFVFDMTEHQIADNYGYSMLCKSIEIILLALIKVAKKHRKQESFEVHLDWKQYLLFNTVTFCLFFIIAPVQFLLSGREMSLRQMSLMAWATSLGCMILVIVTIWQSVIVKREIQLKEQNIMNEMYLELQKEYYEELLRQDEKMGHFRHDMEAHMTVLQSYCADGVTKEMQEYLDNVIQESAVYEVKEYTGNKGVDAIVRQLNERAEQSQITMKFEGKLPENPMIKEYDLCTIIANLLKNAIEACEKINEQTKREVAMTTAFYNSQIYITIKNTVAEDIVIRNNRLETTKKDKKYHGIGSRNVEQAIKKYNGKLEYQCKDGWFAAEVSL